MCANQSEVQFDVINYIFSKSFNFYRGNRGEKKLKKKKKINF